MESLSQNELIRCLVSIFPAFEAEWMADTEHDVFRSESLHAVYQSFLPFVATFPATDKQWAALAKLLSDEVLAGGVRENAVSTCFLEHCGQVKLTEKLRPLLDSLTRSRLHA